eukprot:6538641-Ditylum_brightwellii.AAC.1
MMLPPKNSTLVRKQLGLLTTDDAGGRQYCEAERNYSIRNTILSSKTYVGQGLLCRICNDGEHNKNEEERSDDSSCISTESWFDEGEKGKEEDITFKFVDLPKFQAKEVMGNLKYGWRIIEVDKISKKFIITQHINNVWILSLVITLLVL